MEVQQLRIIHSDEMEFGGFIFESAICFSLKQNC